MIKLKNYLEKNDKIVPLRLSASVWERVKIRAKAHNATASNYIRAAVLKMLDEEDLESD